MITKVVLGVALVLIEFSIITRSQNDSLSSVLEATPLSKDLVGAVDEASTKSVEATSKIPKVVTNETTSSIRVDSVPEFTTTTVDITTIEVTSTVATTEEFKLPENCSAYKVCRHRLLRNIFDSINHQHVFRLSSSKTSRERRSRRQLRNAVRSIRTINMNSESDLVQIARQPFKWAPFKPSSTRTASKTKSSTSPSALQLRIIAKSKCFRAVAHLSVNYLLSSIFSGLIYNENYDDILYVIQNGSLLRVDGNHESFDIYDHYCLELDDEEGVLTAVVCEFDDMLLTVGRVQGLIFATCMLLSVPVSCSLS